MSQQFSSNPPQSPQSMEKLPQKGQPHTIAISNSNPNDNIELAINPEKRALERLIALQTAKSYFSFGTLFTALGFIFAIVSMTSCSFATVNWQIDGNDAAYRATITHLGLYRWYNPATETCWAYNPDDVDFFYVDGAAQGLSAMGVVLGGIIGGVACMVMVGYMCLGRELGSKLLFGMAGGMVLSSIMEIATLTYFQQGNVPEFAITCNANEDSDCVMSSGAMFAVVSFIMYLIAGLIYGLAGVGCRRVEKEEEADGDEGLPPPPPPPLPPRERQERMQRRQVDEESGPPPPAPMVKDADEDDSLMSL